MQLFVSAILREGKMFENDMWGNKCIFRREHKKWKECSGLTATPTILVNGKILPSDYSVEDLEFITSL